MRKWLIAAGLMMAVMTGCSQKTDRDIQTNESVSTEEKKEAADAPIIVTEETNEEEIDRLYEKETLTAGGDTMENAFAIQIEQLKAEGVKKCGGVLRDLDGDGQDELFTMSYERVGAKFTFAVYEYDKTSGTCKLVDFIERKGVSSTAFGDGYYSMAQDAEGNCLIKERYIRDSSDETIYWLYDGRKLCPYASCGTRTVFDKQAVKPEFFTTYTYTVGQKDVSKEAYEAKVKDITEGEELGYLPYAQESFEDYTEGARLVIESLQGESAQQTVEKLKEEKLNLGEEKLAALVRMNYDEVAAYFEGNELSGKIDVVSDDKKKVDCIVFMPGTKVMDLTFDESMEEVIEKLGLPFDEFFNEMEGCYQLTYSKEPFNLDVYCNEKMEVINIRVYRKQ